jgi:hypothetical protein
MFFLDFPQQPADPQLSLNSHQTHFVGTKLPDINHATVTDPDDSKEMVGTHSYSDDSDSRSWSSSSSPPSLSALSIGHQSLLPPSSSSPSSLSIGHQSLLSPSSSSPPSLSSLSIGHQSLLPPRETVPCRRVSPVRSNYSSSSSSYTSPFVMDCDSLSSCSDSSSSTLSPSLASPLKPLSNVSPPLVNPSDQPALRWWSNIFSSISRTENQSGDYKKSLHNNSNTTTKSAEYGHPSDLTLYFLSRSPFLLRVLFYMSTWSRASQPPLAPCFFSAPYSSIYWSLLAVGFAFHIASIIATIAVVAVMTASGGRYMFGNAVNACIMFWERCFVDEMKVAVRFEVITMSIWVVALFVRLVFRQSRSYFLTTVPLYSSQFSLIPRWKIRSESVDGGGGGVGII